jgi:hypothetical protein
VEWNPSEKVREMAAMENGTDDVINQMLDEALAGMR